jgi:hypothetical protein
MADEKQAPENTDAPPINEGAARFVEGAGKVPLVHPALRKRVAPKRVTGKMRRTTVRTVKLAGWTVDDKRYVGQFPIEPSFNNGGNLTDSTAPLRFYLDQDLEWPHEVEELQAQYPGIVCAVMDCWDQALVNFDAVRGTERCTEHEAMWQRKEIRYATSAHQQPAIP